MSKQLKEHIGKFTNIKENDLVQILKYFKNVSYGKKENLMVEGQICKYHFFVLKGCLRKFYINDHGVEQTTEFAIENWWITDHMAFERQRKTDFYIQAVEKTDLLMIDFKSQENLLNEYPQMERYFRFIYQRGFAALQMHLKHFSNFSKEEIYHMFAKVQPEFVKRVPQYLLASFLGFTPEYLSEIRAKKRS
ncbi:MAG: Crp/Fnr family transcriptional regulator [Bacteroidia bacterium]|nr:Crp/Fnr family transcriptional regulator [Bacteroidia bacterium]